jgi:TRAP-type C4-dicarboxylate transport system permease small subunit
MARLQRLDRCLALVEGAAVGVLLAGLLGLGLWQMLLRNLFASGLFWGDALLRHLVLWLAMLGASLATREQQHLSLDLLTRFLPGAYRPWMTLLTNLGAVLVCALLSQAAWRFVQDEYTAGTMLDFGVATWIAQSILPLGFLSMTLRFALRVLEALRQLGRRPPRL